MPADFLGLCRTTLRDAIDQLSSPPATPSPKCRCSAGPRRTVAPNPDGRVEQRSIHYNPIRLQRTMSGVVNVLHIPHYASIAGPRRTISEHPARTWSIAPTAWGTPHPKKPVALYRPTFPEILRSTPIISVSVAATSRP